MSIKNCQAIQKSCIDRKSNSWFTLGSESETMVCDPWDFFVSTAGYYGAPDRTSSKKVLDGKRQLIRRLITRPKRLSSLLRLRRLISRLITRLWRLISRLITRLWRLISQLITGPWRLISQLITGPWRLISRLITRPWRLITRPWRLISRLITRLWRLISRLITCLWRFSRVANGH